MPTFKMLFLGSPKIELNGQIIDISNSKAVALLAYLAMTAESQSRDTLSTLIWPDKDQSQARTYLRHALWILKKALGDRWLSVSREYIGLKFDTEIWVDAQAFREGITAVLKEKQQAGQMSEAGLTQLSAAVAYYRDDFLSGFTLRDSPTFDDWQFFQAEELRQLQAQALEHLVQEYLAQQAFDTAILYARSWLALDYLLEPAHRILMQLYALNSQQNAAIRQYQECVRLLNEELGIEPEEETTALYKTIRNRQLRPPKAEVSSPGAAPKQGDDRFIIGELLDRGAHGEVYLGLDNQTDKPVIIKRLRTDVVKADSGIIARFRQEAEALQKLNHPNIVCLLDTFEKDGQQHLVMEYIPTGSLAQRLKNEPLLPLHEVLAIALELADALSRAHHLGIIHRDVKPENVLIAPDGTPRLIDFGVARLLNKDTHMTGAGTFLGSPAYMSPEMLSGEESSIRSDIWSFGVLLFEMLADRRPFPEEQLTAVMVSILNDPAPDIRQFRPDIPDELANLIEHLLVKNPEGRLSSMRLVAAQLELIRNNTNRGQLDNLSTMLIPNGQSSLGPLTSRPTRSASFVGRTLEQDDIQRSLQNPICRLITIMGPGGIGKTQLAMALTASIGSWFPDGLYFVPLTPLQTADDIITEIGSSFDLQFSKAEEPLEQLIRYLNRKHLLLILDNFEHVMAGASIISKILEAAPSIKIIVTSRERLNLSNEIVYPLGGLRFPDQDRVDATEIRRYSAVQLLLQRGELVRPNPELDSQTIAHIIQICRLVDGIPLALVLAASWLDLLSFEEVANEIERGLDFLETEMRDIPDRQSSMRAVFDASWQRLTPKEQQALMGLTVFHGGFTREAAQIVAESGPLILKKLLNKSLLMVDDNGRFDMHELLRQYVQEHIHSTPAIAAQTRERHANYYTSLFNNLDDQLKGTRQKSALKTIGAELENVRVSWRWLITQGQWESIVYQILPSLFRYCELRFKAFYLCDLISEAMQGLEKSGAENPEQYTCLLQIAQAAFFYTGVINRLKFENEARIGEKEIVTLTWQQRKELYDLRSLRWQILLAFLYGQLVDVEEAKTTLVNILPMVRQEAGEWELALAHQCLGQLFLFTKAPEAKAHLLAALDIFQKIGDAYETSITRYIMGLLFMDRQQLIEARTHLLLAQQQFLGQEDIPIFALINWNLANVYIRLGQYETGIDALRQSYQMLIAKGILRSALAFLSRESYESLRYGTIDRALKAAKECLSIVSDADDPLGEPWYIWETGEIYRVKGDLQQARHFYERAYNLFKQTQDHYDPTFFQQGMAFYHRGMANIAFAQEKFEEARDHLQESLKMARASEHLWITTYTSIDLGRTLLMLHQPDEAQALFIQALNLVKQITNGGMAMIALAGVTMLYTFQDKWDVARQLGFEILNHPQTWRETKSQIRAILNEDIPVSDEQKKQISDSNWAWIELVDRELNRLECWSTVNQ